MKKQIKFNPIPIFELIIAFFLVVDCETIWKWDESIKAIIKLLSYSGILGSSLILVLMGVVKQHNIKQKRIVLIGGTIVFWAIYFLINSDNDYLFSLFCISSIFVLMLLYQTFYYKDERWNIWRYYSNIMLIFAISSLIFYVFGSLFNVISPNCIAHVDFNGAIITRQGYSYLYYESQHIDITLLGVQIWRNCGCFYEAPKYALSLILSLLYELFINKKISKFKTLILGLTIITTTSSTGIILMIFIFIYRLIINKSKDTYIKLLKAFVIIGAISVGFYISVKLYQAKISTFSGLSRVDDYIAGYKAWVEHPMFGNGYLNNNAFITKMSSFRSDNVGFSNSLFRVLVHGGIYFLLLYIVPIFSIIKKGIRCHNHGIAFIGIMFLMLFVTTSFPYNYISMYILAVFLIPNCLAANNSFY